MYGKPEAAAGWHFLVGEEVPVKTLADTVGFQYRYDPQQDEFSHRSGIVVIPPEGAVSRISKWALISICSV